MGQGGVAPPGAAVTDGLLSGLRVVDLTANMSGPYATMLLADQGADVIKVEPPRGEVVRRVGTGRDGFSAYFANLNRSKRSIVVDLRQPGAPEVIVRLVEGADVLVQNFRPGVLERFGLDAGKLCARFPQLIYVSISGFGQTGPLAAMPAYDHVVQSLSGMAAVQAPKGGQPTLARHGVVDKATGIMAAEAVLAALFARSRTGRGTHVELSMLDVALSFVWPDGMMNHTCLDDVTTLPPIAGSFRLTATADGFVSLITVTDAEFRSLITAVGLQDRLEDPDLASLDDRLRNGGNVMREVGAILATLPTERVVALMREHGVPCMPVVALDDVVATIESVLPEALDETVHPTLGRIVQPRPPVLAEAYDAPTTPAPDAGAHTDAVLGEAGFSEAEVAELRRAGVVG
jgi:crotonobetainyl-CoA:carnitine CoA-transferase CaiB-like acyl-CoA transferase